MALHYYYTSPSHWCTTHEVSNCKFHNGCRTISRHADGFSRYSVPPSAGPLLPLILTAKRVFVSPVGSSMQQSPPPAKHIHIHVVVEKLVCRAQKRLSYSQLSVEPVMRRGTMCTGTVTSWQRRLCIEWLTSVHNNFLWLSCCNKVSLIEADFWQWPSVGNGT